MATVWYCTGKLSAKSLHAHICVDHSYLWIYCIYTFIYWGYLLFNLFMIMTCKAADSCYEGEIAADVFPCLTRSRILVVAKFYFSEQCVDVLLCV